MLQCCSCLGLQKKYKLVSKVKSKTKAVQTAGSNGLKFFEELLGSKGMEKSYFFIDFI